jgi:hypothetical protein
MAARWLFTVVLVLVLAFGCASAAEYQAAQAVWEARDAQGPADCPATRRVDGMCIADGP